MQWLNEAFCTLHNLHAYWVKPVCNINHLASDLWTLEIRLHQRLHALCRSFFGKKDGNSPSTSKSKQSTLKKRTVDTTQEGSCDNDDITQGSPERGGKTGLVADSGDSPVFKRKTKKRKRVIIDSDDGEDGEGEDGDGEGREGETAVKGEGEKMEDSEGGEQMVEDGTENGEMENEKRLENGKKEEEMEMNNEGKSSCNPCTCIYIAYIA